MADEDVLRIIVRGQGGAEGIRALDSLLARLTTAETERRRLEGRLADANTETDAARQSEANAWQMWNDAKQVLDGVDEAEARVEALQAERDELARRMMSATERIAKQSDALREYRVLYSNGSYTRGIFDAQEAITLASLYRDAVVEGRTCWATLDAARAALACPPPEEEK